MSDTKERRIAIIGTAPTFKDTPWDDPTLEIWALNDMHLLGIPRADRWYDLHPFDKMHFRKKGKKVYSTDVPAGYFVRPEGHLDYLRSLQIPVYVQDAKQLGSPSAVTFPKAEIQKAIGPYFASSPAWMVGHALYEGCTELHIYGIHLATEWEYLKQKPNLALLLGMAIGRGIAVVMPKGSPLLRETHEYAYQSDPDLPKVAVQKRLEGLQEQRAVVLRELKAQKWYQRNVNLRSRLSWLDAQIVDTQLALQTVVANRSPLGV